MSGIMRDNPDNVLGFNSGDNRYDSSSVYKNADGSIIERLEYLQDYLAGQVAFSVNSKISCYPSEDDGVDVLAGTGAYTLGSFVEIIPADTITTDFRLFKMYIDDSTDSSASIWELVFYSGAEGSEVEIARVRQSSDGKVYGDAEIPTPVLSANTRISCKACHITGAETITISLGYQYV